MARRNNPAPPRDHSFDHAVDRSFAAGATTSETTYFWQGGRKIELRQDDAAVTIHTEDAAAAPGLIRLQIVGDRDHSISRPRAEHNVVHHGS